MNLQATLFDLSKVPHDDVLDITEARLCLTLDRAAGHYSALNGTAGFPTSAGTWVRLAWHRPAQVNAETLTGFEAALDLDQVPRPIWRSAATWHDDNRDVVWRADEMTQVTDPAVSATGFVTTDPGLPDTWWADLRTASKLLAAHPTRRVCMTQEHLSRRIAEVYGDELDTTITAWATVHGDLGWANVCAPTLTLIDWESWGRGPAALDAATLWVASLQVPSLAAKVLEVFDEVLSTRTGQLVRLMQCANVARAFSRTSRKGPLTDIMAAHATELLAELT
ncbi:aminoglycoside phosphotransferase [Actinomadura harenae]|uniref:Aminoglycoside phosphotransferase n=1 Tax=Actinomadura harenae TaxID=2483351 RepID=A0A3M2LPS2_9ACTN|nr:aminoglycoside phosphotransferase [Actinomadura harenae]RMI39439.1 aminoglycoside phosphotransferase [Actinomadura harenae]